MKTVDKRQKFRAVLAGGRAVRAGSVWDPVSARLADRLGIEVGLMGGSLGSFAVLGVPDVIVLTLSELADQVRRACRASSVALLVDADHGYGNSLNVMRTVEELEHAGVAALTIEDTLLPRAFGAGDKPQLTPVAEGVAKMRAALAARRDPALAIVGRTSASQITDVDDAIQRLNAYEAAGVDALMIPGVKSRTELDRLSAGTKLPLVIGGGGPELSDIDYLASRRVRVFSAGHQAFAASVQAIHDALRAAQGAGAMPPLAGKELTDWVTQAGDYELRARNFL
ncbi:MAG: isocitrate lyase/PEP mutase family protein [Rhodospirillales bacterium]|nr:isocitrate lyase/PEP mutase family protein [Rhodospirillales bacterium]